MGGLGAGSIRHVFIVLFASTAACEPGAHDCLELDIAKSRLEVGDLAELVDTSGAQAMGVARIDLSETREVVEP